MGSLTHVCVWSSKGWTHIAPEEVARSHPGESVSARSGLFMCELCGQYAHMRLTVLVIENACTELVDITSVMSQNLFNCIGVPSAGRANHREW